MSTTTAAEIVFDHVTKRYPGREQPALDDLTLDRVIGVTHPDNHVSQRVLMKAGLADRGLGRYYGLRLRLFAMERPR